MLQHAGTMDRGEVVTLAVNVVPDSGAGDLTGLADGMTTAVDAGRHVYTFRYTPPDD